MSPPYCTWIEGMTLQELRDHDILQGCQQARRMLRLIVKRGMSIRAARIVVDAAMYGIGCTEGQVRATIESEKRKVAIAAEKENNV